MKKGSIHYVRDRDGALYNIDKIIDKILVKNNITQNTVTESDKSGFTISVTFPKDFIVSWEYNEGDIIPSSTKPPFDCALVYVQSDGVWRRGMYNVLDNKFYEVSVNNMIEGEIVPLYYVVLPKVPHLKED